MILGIFRLGVALWAACALAALLISREAWLGVLLGGGIGLANFWGLTRIVGALARPRPDRPPRRGLLGTLLAGKFLLLSLLIFLILRHVPVHPVAFLVGISIFVAAILGGGLRGALGPTTT